MKRKQAAAPEILTKLEKKIEKLLAAAERLGGAADHGRRQIDRLAELIARAEDILRRNTKRGISIESDGQYDTYRPTNVEPENNDNEQQGERLSNYGFGHFVEFSSYEELKKFQKMPPISGDDIESCDFDEVIRRLLLEGEEDQA